MMKATTPVLELTFREVAGSPWEGMATVRFQGEPGDPFRVREGLTPKEREDVRWYVEDYMDYPEAGNATRAGQIERRLEEYGRSLWDGLEGPALGMWLGAVQAKGAGRLELRAADPRDEIAFRTPWELMRVGLEASGPGTLLHQLKVTVVRRVNVTLPPLEIPDTSRGLRVLTIVCRPDDAGFPDPRHTPEAILKALEGRPEVSVDFCRPNTLAALTDELQKAADAGRPYHVVHFNGHGGVGVLSFEKADGMKHAVRAQRFGDLMAGFDIPLVVLEACRSAEKISAQETVAGALLRQGVGTVVGMGHAVHVDMTRHLMVGFYGAIARGQSLGQALQAGRNQLMADQVRKMGAGPDATEVELQDWFVPQLYQGADDPVLLSKKPSRRKPEPEPPFEGFLDAPRAGFQGRGYALHNLERAVLHKRAVVVHGPGGMGKTALAREAAHWWTRTGMFPDGALFVSFERTPSPEALVNELGQMLEGIEFLKRQDKVAWLEEQFTKRRILLVWDNFESVLPAFNGDKPTPPEFGRWVGEWTRGGTRILLTCRASETGLDAWPFPLYELSRPEGLLLLVRFLERVGIDRAARERLGWSEKALSPIVEKTGGHPLALELLAPFIEKLGPKQVADELGSLLAKAEQEHPEGRNRSMWASLDFSIRHLSDEARAALPAVALLSGGCLENMARRVAGLEEGAWSTVRRELERTGLVRSRGPLLLPHPVLSEVESLSASAELLERFIRVLSALCREYKKLVRSADPKPALAALGGCELVVRRAIDHATEIEKLPEVWDMADSLRVFLQRTGRGGEGARLMTDVHDRAGLTDEGELTHVTFRLACASAWARAAADADGAAEALRVLVERLDGVRAGDTRFDRATTLTTLGRVHRRFRHRPADALAPLEEAEALFETLEKEGETDTSHRAVVLGDRANALCDLGRFDEALAVAEMSLELDRQLGDPSAVARGLGRLASISAARGRLQEAEVCYGEALEKAREAGDDEALGITSQHLGALALQRDRLEEAASHLRNAISAFQRVGDERGHMQVLNSLGEVDRKRRNSEAALAWYERSLELAQKLGDPEGQAMARSNRAIVLSDDAQAAGDPRTSLDARRLLNRAISEEREALRLHEQLGRPAHIATSRSNLANHLQLAGLLDEAETHAREALAIRERTRDRRIWMTLGILGNIAEARGDTAGAAEYCRRKEAAYQEAEERAGTPLLPQEAVVQLLRLALTARARTDTLDAVLSAAGVKEGLMAVIEDRTPWLAAHLRALAGGQSRPGVEVPEAYRDVVDQAWDAVS